jgi:hypothetical protein
VTIFGELFGGVYPHPEVKDEGTFCTWKVNNSIGHQPVQKGVYYCPTVEFYAFDINVTPKNKGPTDQLIWANYNDAVKIFKSCDFFYAIPVAEGSIEDCLAFDINTNSTIPKLLGMPSLSMSIHFKQNGSRTDVYILRLDWKYYRNCIV